ncbi:Nn.00g112380.m01.CDS01 [Neocucurbitaria sp. VM-36]
MEPTEVATPPSMRAGTDRYWEALVDCGYDRRDDPFVARFGRLSRLNIAYQFNELIKIKSDIRINGKTNQEQMDQLGSRLHQYTNALRDYQYMSQLPPLPSTFADRQRTELEHIFESLAQPHSQQTNPAPAKGANINLGGERNVPYDNQYLSLNLKPTQKPDPVREFLRLHLPRQLSWTEEEKIARRADYSRGILPPEMYSPALNRIARFLVGIVGGAWLIVPLLIMAVHLSLTKTMITVCTAVVLFALAVSLVFELDNKDIVTATATYAAVLVVFVGTSTSAS